MFFVFMATVKPGKLKDLLRLVNSHGMGFIMHAETTLIARCSQKKFEAIFGWYPRAKNIPLFKYFQLNFEDVHSEFYACIRGIKICSVSPDDPRESTNRFYFRS